MTGERRPGSDALTGTVEPGSDTSRLFGVDAARGLALLGMFVAHTVFTGSEKIVDGRSAVLFATVAGVSLGLLSGGQHPAPPAERASVRLVVLARGAALIVLGVFLTLVVQPPIAVILDYYGLAFIALIAVLFLRRVVLGGLAVVVALGAPLIVGLITVALPYESVPEVLQLFGRWLIWGDYPILVWFAYLLAGLLLGRSDLRNRSTALIAIGAGALSAVLGYSAGHLIPGLTAAAHSDSTAEVFGSGGVAIVVIGVLSLLDSATGLGARAARLVRFVLTPVAAAGAMALTLYTAQAVGLRLVRDAVTVNGRWEVPDWTLPALIVGSLVFATLWRRFVGSGPLEAGLRAFATLISTTPERPRVDP